MHNATSAAHPRLIITAAALALAACTHAGDRAGPPPGEATYANPGGLADQSAGAAPHATSGNSGEIGFIQAACGGCHAVEPGYLSPNPQAPRWIDIANRPGLDRTTLARWLYDAHNYPEVMDFDLDPKRAEQIADYMLKMRSDDYRPIPE